MHIIDHMQLIALPDDKMKRKGPTASAITGVERVAYSQVPPNRQPEILEYLKLFGYKPDKTIIQVHVPGFFNKKRTTSREAEKRQASARKYGGRTFVIVGRTHDTAITDLIAKPKKRPALASPGYFGYLWKDKDPKNRAPHEMIPLDFTPIHLSYPQDGKDMFATKGFMLAMHVPTSFAKNKNRLTMALYRVGKTTNAKKQWNFIDEIRGSGYEQMQQTEDPLNILKVRVARSEITKEYYEKLRQALAA